MKGLGVFVLSACNMKCTLLFINSIILTWERHVIDLIAGKVFGKIPEFNTQLYLVLKPFKDLNNRNMGKLSKRGVFAGPQLRVLF